MHMGIKGIFLHKINVHCVVEFKRPFKFNTFYLYRKYLYFEIIP